MNEKQLIEQLNEELKDLQTGPLSGYSIQYGIDFANVLNDDQLGMFDVNGYQHGSIDTPQLARAILKAWNECDVSKTKDLLTEARGATTCRCVDAPEQECGTHGDATAKLIGALADALEALATRVPAQVEPNAKVIIRGRDTDCAHGVCMKGCSHLMWFCDQCSCEGGWGMAEDRLTVIAAEHVCPPPPVVQGEPTDDRATLKRIAEVASEQRLKDSIAEYKAATSDEMKPTDWELEFWHAGYKSGALSIIEHQLSRTTVPNAATETFAEKLEREHGALAHSQHMFAEVSAERDAALAAVERVRSAKFEVDSVHQIHGTDCLCGFSSARSRSRTGHITEAMVAALDGGDSGE